MELDEALKVLTHREVTDAYLRDLRAWSATMRRGGERIRAEARQAVAECRDARRRHKALAVLRADPGTWFCVACWARASGLQMPEEVMALRAYAHAFANNGTPKALSYSPELCAHPGHEGRRLALCARINP